MHFPSRWSPISHFFLFFKEIWTRLRRSPVSECFCKEQHEPLGSPRLFVISISHVNLWLIVGRLSRRSKGVTASFEVGSIVESVACDISRLEDGKITISRRIVEWLPRSTIISLLGTKLSPFTMMSLDPEWPKRHRSPWLGERRHERNRSVASDDKIAWENFGDADRRSATTNTRMY